MVQDAHEAVSGRETRTTGAQEEEPKYVIYALVNDKKEAFYVGMTANLDSRMVGHRQNYGRSIKIKALARASTKTLALDLELSWIAKLTLSGHQLANVVGLPSDPGTTPSKEYFSAVQRQRKNGRDKRLERKESRFYVLSNRACVVLIEREHPSKINGACLARKLKIIADCGSLAEAEAEVGVLLSSGRWFKQDPAWPDVVSNNAKREEALHIALIALQQCAIEGCVAADNALREIKKVC